VAQSFYLPGPITVRRRIRRRCNPAYMTMLLERVTLTVGKGVMHYSLAAGESIMYNHVLPCHI